MRKRLAPILLIALGAILAGCGFIADRVPPPIALPALQAGEAALEIGAAVAEGAALTARVAAESAETPWGVMSGYLLALGLAAGAKFLRSRLTSAREALRTVTAKIEARDAGGVKESVQATMAGKPEGVRAELERALTGPN